MNNDSDKDVNNEKDDIFETITAKEQVMIFLMTKDSFLLQGFWQLKDNHEMIKINSLSEIKKVGNKPFKVIIDTYHNHILDEEAIKFLEKLDAEDYGYDPEFEDDDADSSVDEDDNEPV